jgi:hypothetical protein
MGGRQWLDHDDPFVSGHRMEQVWQGGFRGPDVLISSSGVFVSRGVRGLRPSCQETEGMLRFQW